MQAALKEAMLNKDTARRDAIRMAMSAIKQVEVDERRELTAEDVVVVLQKEVKTLRESIQEWRNAGRGAEQIAELEHNLSVLESFLPEQLSREDIAALAQEAIAQTGATSVKEMGKVMSALMPKVKGKADGKLVNEVVRELLG
ncbi:MAG: GatB/YqeY domain-containing protein [Anaerolineaceae bacterium]|nr:GatB/YqeY domain-containing protein [Anaerolineaceae bacterium]